MTKEQQIEELAKLLIKAFDRETIDRFIENDNGDLIRIETISLYAVAEQLFEVGYRKVEAKE